MPSLSLRQRTRPSIDDRFRRAKRLAVTWFELQFRRDIPQPDDSREAWVVEHERVYGIGRFDERVELLQIALSRAYSAGVPVAPMLAILRRAKHAQHLQTHAGAHLDWSRQYSVRLQKIQRHLDAAADLLAALHSDVNPDEYPVATDLCRSTERRIREALIDHPLFQHYRQRRFRRARAGRPSKPWVKRARRQLGRIGVPPDLRDNLLEAVGLIPYRPRRAR